MAAMKKKQMCKIMFKFLFMSMCLYGAFILGCLGVTECDMTYSLWDLLIATLFIIQGATVWVM